MPKRHRSCAALALGAALATGCGPPTRATVGPCRPLHYAHGADAAEDRPAHVRSASALSSFPGGLAVVQDDARFVAVVGEGGVESVALPPGSDGLRLHDDARGTKDLKLDLEAALTLEHPRRGMRLVAFGSGSSPRRRGVVVVDGTSRRVQLLDASSLHAGLRARPELAGGALNLEGAVVTGGVVRLFHRGNDGPAAVNASFDLDRRAFEAWIDGTGPAPSPRWATRWDLGEVDGVPYGFTDAAVAIDGRVLFLAVAEASPDALRDGPVLGAIVGTWLREDLVAARILERDGAPTRRKLEGLAPAIDGTWKVVVDADDPARAAELCDLRLEGPW
jgi:hypothetical protein